MLARNQNGMTGKLVKRVTNYSEKLDIWQTIHKSKANEGWIGVFNSNPYMDIVKFSKEELGLNKNTSYTLYVFGENVL